MPTAAALLYVIGTEVPKPGGETEALGGLAVTEPERGASNLRVAPRGIHCAEGCRTALSRVIGIVVQPGVDFGNSQIFDFDKEKAATLERSVAGIPARRSRRIRPTTRRQARCAIWSPRISRS